MANSEQQKSEEHVAWVTGIAVLGCLLVSVSSLYLALFAEYHEVFTTGMYLLAAAVAFGLLANAGLRN